MAKHPLDKLASVYGKPLVRDLSVSPQKALEKLKRVILAKVREKLVQSTFSERAKRAFHRSLSVKVTGSTLTLEAKHPAFKRMLQGQHRGQMTWLTKARAPIPIITDKGELIFRSATAKSMKDGKWVHPGRAAHSFIEKAKDEAKAQIKEKLAAEIRRAVKAAAKKRR